MDTTTIKLEDAIRIAIRHDGRTLDELAEATGLDRKTLSNWQTGKTKPSFPALVEFAAVVRKPVSFFAQAVTGATHPSDWMVERLARVYQGPWPTRDEETADNVPGPGQLALFGADRPMAA